MSTINLEQLVIKHLQSYEFASTLAEFVSSKHGAQLLDDFNNSVNKAMEEKVKAMVAEYIEAHMTDESIQSRIKAALQSITKAELLEKL